MADTTGRTTHVYAGVNRLQGGKINGVFRLKVGEQQFEKLAGGLPDDCDVQTVALHPASPDTVFVGTQNGPYWTTDRGEHWARAGFPDKDLRVWSLLVHPTNPNHLRRHLTDGHLSQRRRRRYLAAFTRSADSGSRPIHSARDAPDDQSGATQFDLCHHRNQRRHAQRRRRQKLDRLQPRPDVTGRRTPASAQQRILRS